MLYRQSDCYTCSTRARSLSPSHTFVLSLSHSHIHTHTHTHTHSHTHTYTRTNRWERLTPTHAIVFRVCRPSNDRNCVRPWVEKGGVRGGLAWFTWTYAYLYVHWSDIQTCASTPAYTHLHGVQRQLVPRHLASIAVMAFTLGGALPPGGPPVQMTMMMHIVDDGLYRSQNTRRLQIDGIFSVTRVFM